MTTSFLFERVAIIGMGLIGSSLARVIKRDGLARHIVASARTEQTMKTAIQLGIADSVASDAADAVRETDLVVICTPVSTYSQIARRIAPNLAPGTIVSDVGSVKSAVIAAVMPHIPDSVHFVPGHPIAGTENSGPEAGFDTLFEGHWFLITPPPGTDPSAVERVAELWRRAGSKIEIMDPIHHDHVLAITSHVPHLIAYTISYNNTRMALLLFRLQFLPSLHLVPLYKLSDCKRVFKYRWPRIETIRVTQEAT